MVNLLKNGSFNAEDVDGPGSAYVKFDPGTLSGLLPEYWWLMEYSKPGDPKLASQDQDWGVAEIIPIKYRRQFPERYLLYPPEPAATNDDFILKAFRGGQPVMFKIGQSVKALLPGHYTFTAPTFPDQKTWDGKRPGNPAGSADWYLASEVQIGANLPNGVVQTGWKDARVVPIGQYTPLSITFEHPGGDLNVWFQARGRWGFQQNGWFFDECSLVAAGTDPVPTPAPAPDPTPAPGPQPGTVAAAQAAMAAAQAQIAQDKLTLAEVTGQINARYNDLSDLIKTVQDALK